MQNGTEKTVSWHTVDDGRIDVAFVIQSMKRGGAQRVVSLVANEWAHRGYRISVVTFDDQGEDEFELDENIARHSLQTRNRGHGLFARVRTNIEEVLSLRKVLRSLDPRSVISFIHSTNVRTIVAAAGLRGRVVISERNDPARQKVPVVWAVLRRLLYRFADVVTANSHNALKTLKSYVPDGKLAYIPNPVRALADCAKPKGANSPFILNVGRLHEQKAQNVLLEAFSVFAKGYPDWRLCIIGDGPLRDDLEQQAQRLGIYKLIDWIPHIRDPSPYYWSARIFALPSRYEGVPNALLEAMSCGLPSIVTETCPGALEFVKHEQSGLVISVDDHEALAEALARFASNERLRNRLGRAGRERVSRLSLDHILLTWDQVVGIKSNGSTRSEEWLRP